MADKPSISVIGSYAVGMTLETERFPVGGETVRGTSFSMLHGGKGSNQAIAAARLGAHVHYYGCVGKDDFGDKAIQLFDEEGLDAKIVKRSDKYPTGVGTVLVNGKGENEIVIYLGANEDIDDSDVDLIIPMLKDSRIVLMQLEICMDAVICIAQKCKDFKIPLILNPAPFCEISKELLGCCDYITPNETEARLLLGLKPDDPIPHEEVAKRLLALGVKTVIITLGKKGALIAQNDMCEIIGGLDVKPVDTTGAGDTFSAAFAVALGEGKSLCEAVRFANIAASLSVTKHGVIPSLPLRGEVDVYL